MGRSERARSGSRKCDRSHGDHAVGCDIRHHQLMALPSHNPNELKGFGASPGLIEGEARVINTVDEISRLKQGDILVCANTAPSWAPIFGKIGAAVSDIGTMSHAAYRRPRIRAAGRCRYWRRDQAHQGRTADPSHGSTGRVTILG